MKRETIGKVVLDEATSTTEGAEEAALHPAIGFGGGFFGTSLFGIVLGWFGGPAVLTAWVLAFATSGLACLLGVAAMTCFHERRETDLNPAD